MPSGCSVPPPRPSRSRPSTAGGSWNCARAGRSSPGRAIRHELRIRGEGLTLIVRTPSDVRLPTEPFLLEIRADTTLALGVTDGLLISPVGGEEAGTRPFGPPNPGFGPYLGIDYFVSAGHRVVAPFAGAVAWAGLLADANCTTRAIAIAGPADGVAWLLHLDAITVTAGDRVGYGDMLGTVIAAADDGCIVGLGDHVHLAYRIPDAEGLFRSVDPAPFFIPTGR